MERFSNYLEEKLQPIMTVISNNKYLVAIQHGFFGAMPVMVIGSFFLLLTNFPITGYEEFMASLFGENWSDFFAVPFQVSMNILTLFIFFGIVRSLAKHYKVDSLGATVVSLVAFLILTPTITTEEGALGISMEHLGSGGLFLGIVTAILATEIYKWVINRGWTIKMPSSVPPAVSRSFTSLIPGTIVVIIFNIIRVLFTLTSYGTAYDFVYGVLQAPLTGVGASLPGVLLIIFVESFFWAFGIHGASVGSAALGAVMLSLTAENAQAFSAGAPLPNLINQQFLAVFVNIGGGGATLGLVLLCLLFAKSRRLKLVGKMSIAPGFFMINEPVLFGVPMVLNPIMIIPLILVPITLAIITYIVMSVGLVPYTNGVAIPWTTPPIVGGFLVSGVRGAIFQFIGILISMALYYPFFRIVDREAVDQEAKETEIATES